jgi:hypothetical protein
MKKLYVIPALAAFIATGSFAHASAIPDLVLGFSDTNLSQNLEIDVGSISKFYSIEQNGGTYTIGNIGSIINAYSTDANWTSNSALNWGVAGTVGGLAAGPDGSVAEPKKTVWITQQAAAGPQTLGVQTAGSPAVATSGQLGTPDTDVGKIYTGFNGGTADGSGANFSASLVTIGANANSWNNAVTGGAVFGQFGASSAFYNQTSNLTSGTTYSSSDLFEMLPGAVQYWGTFALDTSTGVLSFTKFVAIPEPSTYAAILGAATLAFVAIRRRKQQMFA